MDFVSTLERTGFPSSEHWSNAQNKLRVRRRNENEKGSYRQQQQGKRFDSPWYAGHSYNITCKWEPFKEQVLNQWSRLTSRELDAIGPNRSKLAILIEGKYGIAAHLVENYLRNFERTLPLI